MVSTCPHDKARVTARLRMIQLCLQLYFLGKGFHLDPDCRTLAPLTYYNQRRFKGPCRNTRPPKHNPKSVPNPPPNDIGSAPRRRCVVITGVRNSSRDRNDKWSQGHACNREQSPKKMDKKQTRNNSEPFAINRTDIRSKTKTNHGDTRECLARWLSKSVRIMNETWGKS